MKPKTSINRRVLSFVGDAVELSSEAATPLLVGAFGYVRYKENRTTGYSWHYTISDAKKVVLAGEDSFQKSVDQNRMGAPSVKVWKFKALSKGFVKVVFKYYRSWLGEKTAVATNTYTILVQ